ncbi:MAG: hypothetical protein PHI98_14845 [Eubacteriales bacterium]|nr:hypothetical protein [Eubacteriales bacterium]
MNERLQIAQNLRAGRWIPKAPQSVDRVLSIDPRFEVRGVWMLCNDPAVRGEGRKKGEQSEPSARNGEAMKHEAYDPAVRGEGRKKGEQSEPSARNGEAMKHEAYDPAVRGEGRKVYRREYRVYWHQMRVTDVQSSYQLSYVLEEAENYAINMAVNTIANFDSEVARDEAMALLDALLG